MSSIPNACRSSRIIASRSTCRTTSSIVRVKTDPKTGLIDLADLKKKISNKTAAVYFETPSYLGMFETNAAAIAASARQNGAETIVGVDPLTLGIVKPPADFGADIVVGPTQPLGVHMNCGGGVGGFIASRDEARYVREYNGFLVSITETREPGQFGFGLASAHQTSYGMREKGKDWTGNSVYLWAIANAVYMSLLGPARLQGTRRADHHAIAFRGEAPGRDQGRAAFPSRAASSRSSSSISRRPARPWRRSTRSCASRGSSAARICRRRFPALGQSALYCVTEMHTTDDIDRLAAGNRKGGEVMAKTPTEKPKLRQYHAASWDEPRRDAARLSGPARPGLREPERPS